MGCGRCTERREAISRAIHDARRGDLNGALKEVEFIGRSTVADVRAISRRAVVQRLAILRASRR